MLLACGNNWNTIPNESFWGASPKGHKKIIIAQFDYFSTSSMYLVHNRALGTIYAEMWFPPLVSLFPRKSISPIPRTLTLNGSSEKSAKVHVSNISASPDAFWSKPLYVDNIWWQLLSPRWAKTISCFPDKHFIRFFCAWWWELIFYYNMVVSRFGY
jgi:hypothetical protein